MKLQALFKEPEKTIDWAIEEVNKQSESAHKFVRGVMGGNPFIKGEAQAIMFVIGKLADAGHDGLLAVQEWNGIQ